MQALNAGFSYYYYYYTNDQIDFLYSFIIFLLTIYYVHAIGFRLPGSFDYGFFFYSFYPILMPYALIKRKGWAKGIAFIVAWFIIMNISDFVWLIISVF